MELFEINANERHTVGLNIIHFKDKPVDFLPYVTMSWMFKTENI